MLSDNTILENINHEKFSFLEIQREWNILESSADFDGTGFIDFAEYLRVNYSYKINEKKIFALKSKDEKIDMLITYIDFLLLVSECNEVDLKLENYKIKIKNCKYSGAQIINDFCAQNLEYINQLIQEF